MFPLQTQNLNVLGIPTIPVAIYGKFATFSDFEKFQDCFSKKIILFSKKRPKFWSFREFLLLQSHPTAKMQQFSETLSRSDTWTNIVLVWTQLANIE